MKLHMVVLLTAVCLAYSGESTGSTLDYSIVSEDLIVIENTHWRSTRLDSAWYDANGYLSVYASRTLMGNSIDLEPEIAMIEFGSSNDDVSFMRVDGVGDYYLRIDQAGEDDQQLMIKFTMDGDTLWNCLLESTDEWDNSIEVITLKDGGYLAISNPDCWSNGTYLARISPDGELLWHNWITTDNLMDIPEDRCEIEPSVNSVRETSRGDFIACGSVAQWITSSDAMYIALLDGDSGDVVWKTTNHYMGEASIGDAAEIREGMILAVGATAETVPYEDNDNVALWGERHPLMVILDSDGQILESVICDDTQARGFTGIIETNPANGEFLIVRSKTANYQTEINLVRAIVESAMAD